MLKMRYKLRSSLSADANTKEKKSNAKKGPKRKANKRTPTNKKINEFATQNSNPEIVEDVVKPGSSSEDTFKEVNIYSCN